MKTFKETICCIFVLAISAAASTTGTNYTVKAGGGGNYTTIQACATAMSPGDTCTVFAGTYNETASIPAGSAGSYKTITVNGSDVVSVLGFTLASHTRLIGNCTVPASIGTCGFSIQNLSSPGSHACVAMGTSTDVYVSGNTMSNCGAGLAGSGSCGTGAVSASDTATYLRIQGNTITEVSGPSGGPYGIAIQLGSGDNPTTSASHMLVENNDISHYDLGIKYGTQYSIYRNNTFHDQLETEGCENKHSDMFFSEQHYNVAYNVIEGNTQRNAVGPNAKGVLSQGDYPCSGCTNLIVRYDVTSRIGSSVSSNYPTWTHIVQYNNTRVDLNMEGGSSGQDTDYNDAGLSDPALLNNVYYYNTPSAWSNWNSGSCGSSCNAGHNIYWCVGAGCSAPYGHIYSSGAWTSDPGNKHADPLFVNYVSPGSTSNDYHLQSGSPAIAAGTYLTTVASGDSGSGTSLVVSDASYFQDGYGLSNANSTVQGDCIAVGTASNHSCVTAVNYATNTLTLATSINRSAGQGVYLYSKSDGVQVLTGSAPDMGAFPYGSGSSGGGGSNPPAPPSGLSAIVN